MAHDLTRSEVVPALLAWSYFTGCGEVLADSLPTALGWLRARWDAGDEHLPLNLVHDLGNLLLRGRDFCFASARDQAVWPAAERALRLQYEDRVLGRWAMDRSVMDAHVAIAGMSPMHRDTAVAHAVGLALSRALRDVEGLALGNPAHLRALGSMALGRIPARHEGWAEVLAPGWIEWAMEQLGEVVAGLAVERLFKPEDLWEIAHLPDLPSESARLALREVNGIVAGVGNVSPAVASRLRHKASEVPLDAEASDHYPAGGFDAVSTRGVFENMVRSEVTYVGEGVTTPGGVDLFDVRFAENELLYYTRDESPLLDQRRELTVVIDRPGEQRAKLPGLPAQTLVMVEALALVLQGDLLRVFSPSGSRTIIAWRCVTGADREAAAEERALLAIPLATEIAHRRVELVLANAWDDVPAGRRVVFSPGAADTKALAVRWVRVGDSDWRSNDERWDVRNLAGLRALADHVLVTDLVRAIRS